MWRHVIDGSFLSQAHLSASMRLKFAGFERCARLPNKTLCRPRTRLSVLRETGVEKGGKGLAPAEKSSLERFALSDGASYQ